MPNKETEVQEAQESAERAKSLQHFFPNLSTEHAIAIDKVMTKRLEKLFEDMVEEAPEIAVDQQIVKAAALMYAQSNITAAFKEAFS